MGLIDQLLLQGQDSRLYEALVQQARARPAECRGGINVGLGNMFDIKGPALWALYLIHDADKSPDEIVKVIDEEIERLQQGRRWTQATLDLALVKLRSQPLSTGSSRRSASAGPTCSRASRSSTTTRRRSTGSRTSFAR